jgi:Ca-activated chloride channel family protein
MLVMDLSGTMEAEDFLPGNRLSVSKRVLTKFISNRNQDLVGLVVFGTDAFLVSPLTLDHKRVTQQLQALQVGSIEGMTAIGTALVKGVNHIRKTQLHSKVMILVTDGENNAGDIDPMTAAQLAQAVGVKVYTIGLGKVGGAPMPYIHPVYGKQYVRNPDGSVYLTKLDEPMLQKIASATGGMYFRATDTESLYQIANYIDMLEKTKIQTKRWEDRQSRRWSYILSGILLTLAYGLVQFIVLRRWVS